MWWRSGEGLAITSTGNWQPGFLPWSNLNHWLCPPAAPSQWHLLTRELNQVQICLIQTLKQGVCKPSHLVCLHPGKKLSHSPPSVESVSWPRLARWGHSKKAAIFRQRKSLQRKPTLPTPCSWTSCLHNCEKINSAFHGSHSVVFYYGSPRKLIGGATCFHQSVLVYVMQKETRKSLAASQLTSLLFSASPRPARRMKPTWSRAEEGQLNLP